MTPDAPKSRDTGPQGADLPSVRLGGLPARISPRMALEAYWHQLELTYHGYVDPSILCFWGRAIILRDEAWREHGFISGDCLIRNWIEPSLVPVGGQGLTDQERKWCQLAGQAMAAVLEEEARTL